MKLRKDIKTPKGQWAVEVDSSMVTLVPEARAKELFPDEFEKPPAKKSTTKKAAPKE